MQHARIVALLVALLVTNSVHARLPILGAWQNYYPDSTSDDLECQLCHQSENGGEPWNKYGWALRDIIGGDDNYEEAFLLTETMDLDSDSEADVLDQILANFQPGWEAGNVNTVYFANDSIQANQPPPSNIPETTALDFPPRGQVTNPIAEPISVGSVIVDLVEVAGGFNAPLRAVRAPGIDGSLFVVEQTGRVFRVDLTTGQKTLFLDVSASLVNINSGYDERGLLGLAFHPNYQSNGLFYTYQSEPSQNSTTDFPSSAVNHRSVVVEYKASNPTCNSTVTKRENMLVVDQPQGNHNGGDLVFGPDGYLYISVGDGGGANDQGAGHSLNGNGRDKTNVLGTILRVDPDGSNAANGKYGVPSDNPFTGNGDTGVDEIFAYGLRNPFRMSFDAVNGNLYTGDVGQNEVEEIDLIVNGGNYGWNQKEGSFFFYNPIGGPYLSETAPPNLPPVQDPVAEYDHDEGFSVTGGYVYRGTEIPSLVGRYAFADYNRRLLYADLNSGLIQELQQTPMVTDFITGFGQDVENELYFVTNNQGNPGGTAGKLFRLANPGLPPSYPNPGGESAACMADDDVCVPIKSNNNKLAVICL